MNKKYTFKRLLMTEMKFSLTPIRIFALCIGGLVMPIIFSYLSLFIYGVDFTLGLYGYAISGTTLFIFSRVVTAVQDRATIDKNKAVFLYYKKNWVTSAKLIVEVIIFTIGMLLLFAIATIGTVAHGNNIDYGDYVFNMLKILPGFIATYIFVFSFSKWVISFIRKKTLAYATSIFLTLVLLSPILIFNQISQVTILNFSLSKDANAFSDNIFNNNQLISSFIPILNLGLITGVGINAFTFSAVDNDWYVAIPIVYSFIFVVASWSLQSSSQKRYLVAS